MTSEKSLLLVHAHPDDETIGTGATMAKYLAEGARVTLVTCTAGEMGEILVPELAHLAADRDDALGDHRRGEIENAMAALKAPDGSEVDHRWLGGFGTYRDSGMTWSEDRTHALPDPEARENAFWYADLTEAADHLVTIIREVRPQVLVTYDEFGNYGHPDHIQAHRVATYAAHLAAVPTYKKELGEVHEIDRIFWVALAESRLRERLRAVRAAGDAEALGGMDPEGPLPMATPDVDIAAEIDGTPYADQKVAAMRAYPTQMDMEQGMFAMTNSLGTTAWAHEHFRIAKGSVEGEGLTDLFAGL
ncbi:N-acetyl-1-D-myo-inositol-2-amino-2-deoxy-alpha-D-glucopyranoside deacetylase [Nocardioides sp. NPDC126508]